MVANLEITVFRVIKLAYKEEEGKIEDHIGTFDKKCDNITIIAISKLKKTHKDLGGVLQRLANCNMVKKEFLVMTFTDTLKYN